MSKESSVTYTEKQNQLYALHYLKAKGYYFGRINVMAVHRKDGWGNWFYGKNPYTLKGMPDIMGFIYEKPNSMGYHYKDREPKMFAVEVKGSNGKLSPEQEKFAEHFEAVGGLFIVMRRPEDIESVL